MILELTPFRWRWARINLMIKNNVYTKRKLFYLKRKKLDIFSQNFSKIFNDHFSENLTQAVYTEFCSHLQRSSLFTISHFNIAFKFN